MALFCICWSLCYAVLLLYIFPMSDESRRILGKTRRGIVQFYRITIHRVNGLAIAKRVRISLGSTEVKPVILLRATVCSRGAAGWSSYFQKTAQLKNSEFTVASSGATILSDYAEAVDNWLGRLRLGLRVCSHPRSKGLRGAMLHRYASLRYKADYLHCYWRGLHVLST